MHQPLAYGCGPIETVSLTDWLESTMKIATNKSRLYGLDVWFMGKYGKHYAVFKKTDIATYKITEEARCLNLTG
jgi:hypothetical protein